MYLSFNSMVHECLLIYLICAHINCKTALRESDAAEVALPAPWLRALSKRTVGCYPNVGLQACVFAVVQSRINGEFPIAALADERHSDQVSGASRLSGRSSSHDANRCMSRFQQDLGHGVLW